MSKPLPVSMPLNPTTRYANGLSQKRFAMMMNVDSTTVRLWESGKGRTSKLKKLEMLLAAGDVVTNQIAAPI